MIRSALATACRSMRNERGVALPLALLGLISVSLLVTTALVTSSTELAISSAHRDAAQALYVAEGGLQTYVATRGPFLMADTGATFAYTPPSGTAAEAVNVTVSFLGQQVRGDASILRVFTVDATPVQGGGRRVALMVKQIIPSPTPLSTNITSALTLGGNLDLDGNAFTVSGRSTACGSSGVEAARIASSSQITLNNANHMDGFEGVDNAGNLVSGTAAIERTGMTRDQLALDVLGGKRLSDIIASVPQSHRWGPRYAVNGVTRTWDGVLDTVPTVPLDERVAVVDANRGTIRILGGRGLLIVVNGNIEMAGNSRFDGIIITEGSFWLHGSPQINGALVSLARDVDNRIDIDDEAEINGHVTVSYNRCMVDMARDGFGRVSQMSQAPTVSGTFAWQELVR